MGGGGGGTLKSQSVFIVYHRHNLAAVLFEKLSRRHRQIELKGFSKRLACQSIPNSDCLVFRSGQQSLAVRAEHLRSNSLRMTERTGQGLARFNPQNLHAILVGTIINL